MFCCMKKSRIKIEKKSHLPPPKIKISYPIICLPPTHFPGHWVGPPFHLIILQRLPRNLWGREIGRILVPYKNRMEGEWGLGECRKRENRRQRKNGMGLVRSLQQWWIGWRERADNIKRPGKNPLHINRTVCRGSFDQRE